MDAYAKIIFQSGTVAQVFLPSGQRAEKEGSEIKSQSGYIINSCLQKKKLTLLCLTPNTTILSGGYMLAIIVDLRWRQDHIDLRSSMTLYGIQGHQSYTKNSLKAWSISNACVGSKELCFFPLVDMLTCGTVSKGARWAVLLCGSWRLFWALFRNLLIGACWW